MLQGFSVPLRSSRMTASLKASVGICATAEMTVALGKIKCKMFKNFEGQLPSLFSRRGWGGLFVCCNYTSQTLTPAEMMTVLKKDLKLT
ncbi:hypothetical protein ACFOG5_24605 [Pedobacter fastidiosus]|uniref:hypothetical protein n=1 Tax=Pedobacter fastidiosus TaxID=2765361 RepID=UPI003611B709